MLAVNANYKFGQAKDRAISHNEFFFCVFVWHEEEIYFTQTRIRNSQQLSQERAFSLVSYSLSIRFIVFFSLMLQFVEQTAREKTLHSHKTNEKKIENFFSLSDNQCSWI